MHETDSRKEAAKRDNGCCGRILLLHSNKGQDSIDGGCQQHADPQHHYEMQDELLGQRAQITSVSSFFLSI